MSTPHRGIAALLQKAADERPETESGEKWLRDQTERRLLDAQEPAEVRSARAAYHRQWAEGEKQKRAQATLDRREREKERRREAEEQAERTVQQLERIRYEEDKENRLKQKVLANRWVRGARWIRREGRGFQACYFEFSSN